MVTCIFLSNRNVLVCVTRYWCNRAHNVTNWWYMFRNNDKRCHGFGFVQLECSYGPFYGVAHRYRSEVRKKGLGDTKLEPVWPLLQLFALKKYTGLFTWNGTDCMPKIAVFGRVWTYDFRKNLHLEKTASQKRPLRFETMSVIFLAAILIFLGWTRPRK